MTRRIGDTLRPREPGKPGQRYRVGNVLCLCATPRAAKIASRDRDPLSDDDPPLVVRRHNYPDSDEPCPGNLETFAWSDLIEEADAPESAGPEAVSPSEAARILGFRSRDTIRRMLNSGDLTSCRLGPRGARMIAVQDLERWIEENRNGDQP